MCLKNMATNNKDMPQNKQLNRDMKLRIPFPVLHEKVYQEA